MKVLPTLLNAILAIRAANALMNNWNEPCHTGVCYYDLSHPNGFSPGALMISGMPHAITDITPAGGWEILDCHPNKTEQDIRLVCASEKCSHLFLNGGAEGKILRLPDSCGANPFGRVVKTWDATDKSIPSHIVPRLSRRYRTLPPVKSLRFDVDFHKISVEKMGTVDIAVVASTHPVAAKEIHTQLLRSPPHKVEKRGLFSSIGHALHEAADAIKSDADNVAQKIKDGAEKVGDKIKEGADQYVHNMESGKDSPGIINPGAINDDVAWFKNHTPFGIHSHSNINLLNVTKNGTVFKQAVSCPPLIMGIDVEMHLHAQVEITFGMAISGTIVPPTFSEFKIMPLLSADVVGSITLRSHLVISFDTGGVEIFEAALPGFSVPGVFTLGPKLVADLRLWLALDLSIAVTLGLNYHVGRTQFDLPNGDTNFNDFLPGDMPLSLSISPMGASAILIQPTLTLTLDFGLTVFTSLTGLYIALESYPRATVTLGADVGTINHREEESLDAGSIFPSTELEGRALPGPKTPSTVAETANTPGCFEVDLFFDFNIGAITSFFGWKIYNEITFFRKEFFLLKKCFMAAAHVKPRALEALDFPEGVEWEPELQHGTAINQRSTSSVRRTPGLTKRSLKCLNGTMFYGVAPVVDQMSEISQGM